MKKNPPRDPYHNHDQQKGRSWNSTHSFFVSKLNHYFQIITNECVWVSDSSLLFHTNRAILQLYHGENKLLSMKWWWCLLCITSICRVEYLLASWMKQQSTDRHVDHSDTLSWFRANKSLLLLLKAVCLAKKQQILIS